MGRYFVAVVPAGLKENADLARLIGKLKRTVVQRGRDARWTPPNLWHVTVQFLGNLDDGEFQRLISVLPNWRPQLTEVKFELQGLGAFPALGEARVLWIGVRASKDFLDLQSGLGLFLAENNFSLEDRDYRPHLTLARFRNLQSVRALVELGERKHFGAYAISECVLFESVLQNSVTRYVSHLRLMLRN